MRGKKQNKKSRSRPNVETAALTRENLFDYAFLERLCPRIDLVALQRNSSGSSSSNVKQAEVETETQRATAVVDDSIISSSERNGRNERKIVKIPQMEVDEDAAVGGGGGGGDGGVYVRLNVENRLANMFDKQQQLENVPPARFGSSSSDDMSRLLEAKLESADQATARYVHELASLFCEHHVTTKKVCGI